MLDNIVLCVLLADCLAAFVVLFRLKQNLQTRAAIRKRLNDIKHNHGGTNTNEGPNLPTYLPFHFRLNAWRFLVRQMKERNNA